MPLSNFPLVAAAQSRRVYGPESHNGPPNGLLRYSSGESLPRWRTMCRATKSLPRSRSWRLARGPDAPSGEPPPRSRAWLRLALAPRRRTYFPDRSIKCSGTLRAPGSKANPPTRVVRPSPALCGKASVNSTTLRRPLPYRLHVAPLETGRWNPQKAYDRLLRTRLGRRRDVRPARRVPSVTSGPLRPSRALQCHPRHCGSPGRQTPPHPPLCILRPSVSPTLEQAYRRKPNEKLPRHHRRSRSWITGLATTPARSEILQDDHQLHDTVR
jgi:hypothetical protein